MVGYDFSGLQVFNYFVQCFLLGSSQKIFCFESRVQLFTCALFIYFFSSRLSYSGFIICEKINIRTIISINPSNCLSPSTVLGTVLNFSKNQVFSRFQWYPSFDS